MSLDVLVGLRIVNEFFPVVGAGNQHGAQAGASDRTGTDTKQLPHASYSIKVDGSGRISKQTRQHFRRSDPHDDHEAPPTTRHVTPPRNQRDYPGAPEVNRQTPPATPLGSQSLTPPASPRADDEEIDPLEATVNRGRPRVRRNQPDGPAFQDFGDQNIGDRYVGERNFGDQDVDKPARPASIQSDPLQASVAALAI